MPKEIIINPVAPPTPNAESMRGLHVGWNKIGWVQVATFPFNSESTGDWSIVDLERGDINRLIRSLRRARDQAFGQDA